MLIARRPATLASDISPASRLARKIARGVKDVQTTLASLTDRCATELREGLAHLADNDLLRKIRFRHPPGHA